MLGTSNQKEAGYMMGVIDQLERESEMSQFMWDFQDKNKNDKNNLIYCHSMSSCRKSLPIEKEERDHCWEICR